MSMRVLKFGGTSVANAQRFTQVANIIEDKIKHEQIAVVLSAPAKITNLLVAMVEKTVSGMDVHSNFLDAEKIFADLLAGLAADNSHFPLAEMQHLVTTEFANLKQLLHGIELLGQCPDAIN